MNLEQWRKKCYANKRWVIFGRPTPPTPPPPTGVGTWWMFW